MVSIRNHSALAFKDRLEGCHGLKPLRINLPNHKAKIFFFSFIVKTRMDKLLSVEPESLGIE